MKEVNAPALLVLSGVAWATENGTAGGQPVVTNGVEAVNAARPVHGVNVEAVVAAPHERPFASGARGPPLSVRSRSLKGSWGFPRKLTSRRPVVGSGTAWPSSLTETP